MSNIPLYSPNHGYRLRELEGAPDAIEERGGYYRRVATKLRSVAGELGKLARREKYVSEALDVIRESSAELAGDLEKVETRYDRAAPVLEAYARALRRAQNTTVDPLVPEIRAAHIAHTQAQAGQRAAQRELDGLEQVWPWEDQPTSTELRTARYELSQAQTAAGGAERELEDLWVSFESGYSAWEESYDSAVTNLERAYDASGVNDEWWEDALDAIASVAGIIAAVVVIVALFVAAPIAAVLLVIATVASVIALVATLTMAFAGSRRVGGWDVVFAIVGVVPFLGAFAKGLRGGAKPMESLIRASGFRTTSRRTLEEGRNAVYGDLRSIRGAGGQYGGRAARETRAVDIANRFADDVHRSRGANMWNAIRSGGGRDDGVALTMSQRMTDAWPGGRPGHRVGNWIGRSVDDPGLVMSGVNAFNFGYGGYDAGSDVSTMVRTGSAW